jgi:hypothetical protein
MRTTEYLPIRIALLLALLSGLGVTGMPQGVPGVQVKPVNLSGVSLGPYSPAADVGFAEYLENHAALGTMYPYSAIVKNLSGRAVVGLALRWTWADQAGEENSKYLMSDNLLLGRGPVVASGDTLLVTPDFILPESMLNTGIIMPSSKMIARDAANLSQVSNVTVSLDVIILDDGLVAGPDRSAFVTNIEARREAAVELSSVVISMLQNGRDPSAMIAEAAKQPPVVADLVTAWKARIAKSLQHGNLRLQAEALAKLPKLNFHRGQGPQSK